MRIRSRIFTHIVDFIRNPECLSRRFRHKSFSDTGRSEEEEICLGMVSFLRLFQQFPLIVTADKFIDRLILTLRDALGLTVFLVTHDLDTLYAICDRVAVLADHKVIANAPLAEIEKLDHPWIQEYFHGPRARAARGEQIESA